MEEVSVGTGRLPRHGSGLGRSAGLPVVKRAGGVPSRHTETGADRRARPNPKSTRRRGGRVAPRLPHGHTAV